MQRSLPVIHADLQGSYDADAQYMAAIVNITNRCNLSCAHCFVYRDGNANEAPESVHDEWSDDSMLETLTGLRDRHGIVQMLWMGGEPLLRRRLLEKGIKLFPRNTITTNGTVPLVDFGPNVLYVVSLDGPEDINDPIRGRGVYRRVMRTLDAIPDGFGSPVQVQCVVTPKNEQRLEELVVALQKTRVGWMTFSFYVPKAGEKGGLAWDDVEQREWAVREVMRLREKHRGFVRNTQRSLELMLPGNSKAVTDACPTKKYVLPLYLEGDHFVTPYCCYGNDVDCDRCGGWVTFHVAAKLEAAAQPGVI